MSWQSTAEYYRLLNELTAERLGGLHSARCLLYSVDFAEVAVLQTEERWAEAAELLAVAGERLVLSGAGVVLVCSNTMHLVAGPLAERVPLLHLGDVTAAAVRAAGVTRVGLLGTAFTMERPFYREHLAGHGIEAIVPDADDRALVHRVIYEELCRGIFTDAAREAFAGVVRGLVARGAQGVIYGCTEIELLLDSAHSPIPAFPTTRLHAEAAVRFAVGERLADIAPAFSRV